MRVLVVEAHPDDAALGCGGTLLWHAGRDDEIHILTLTCGEGGQPHPDVRRKEAQDFARYLNARWHPGNINALDFSTVRQERVEVIERVIDMVDPERVYCHNEQDRHQNHAAAAGCTMIAARRVPEVLSFYLPSTRQDFHPTMYKDITDFIETKVSVLEWFQSQADKPYMSASFIRGMARYRAVEGHVGSGESYAEAFKVERMVW